MQEYPNLPGNIQGLSATEIPALLRKYGYNTFRGGRERRTLHILWNIIREPMFILLLIACVLYFILGSPAEGIMMAIAMMIVTAISIFQESKSSRALIELRKFTEPKVNVVRDGIRQVLNSQELVPGDILLLEEGMKVPADALVLQANDLSIDESLVSGESLAVEKNALPGKNNLFQGTTVNSGQCIVRVTATGNLTTLGKIGKSLEGYASVRTLLQLQINRFVKKLALFGLLGFVIILLVNYFHYREWATSLLFALTLAMSAIPEEIPVAFSSFMALGAYKMGKLGIISREPQVIENLGSINVLCLDKTGTLTENRMQVKYIYRFGEDLLMDMDSGGLNQKDTVLYYAVLASEQYPFDPMEIAIQEAWTKTGEKLPELEMIHEYPLEGRPPMMTHVYPQSGLVIAAAKGGVERILTVCDPDELSRKRVIAYAQQLASKGCRVLGVASAIHTAGDLPVRQDEFKWRFAGLLALYDPPRKNAAAVLKRIYAAGINIKLVTGDQPETAINIAGQTGIQNSLPYCTGDEIMSMNMEELQQVATANAIFARMYPDAKLKLINAIKANGDIVAMTGDGVNDGPALKAADIGIAMGKKGTETARRAADLVLTDDDLGKIVIAVSEGRKIFNNLVKAIRYIIAIHIPIILTATIPVLLGWKFPNIFTPIHVIFLELIMAPTCSIFFEREPMETDQMVAAPRSRTAGLFTVKEVVLGIAQGLMITAGILLLYYSYMNNGFNVEETRTVVFTTLILCNVFLTFTNRSFSKTIFHTSRYRNNLVPFVLIVSLFFLCLLHFIPGVRELFQLAPVNLGVLGICLGVSLLSVGWFELYKIRYSGH